MKSKLTFRECRKYIEASKEKEVFLGIKGHEAKKLLSKHDLDNKVIVIVSKEKRVIVINTESGFESFHFSEKSFQKREILASLDAYFLESFNFSLFEIQSNKLLLFLQSEDENVTVLHEEIDFELGFRLRKSYLKQEEVHYVMYYWNKGPMLLCYNKEDEEAFSLSDARSKIQDENALEKVRKQYKSIPCSMKVLKSASEDFTPGIFEEEEFIEEDVIVEVDIPIPEEKEEEVEEEISDELASKLSESAILSLDAPLMGAKSDEESSEDINLAKALEDSVVITDAELPELGKGDEEIFKKYGIDIPEDENGNISGQFMLADDVDFELDEALSLQKAEMDILKKYGVAVSNEEKTSFKEIREAFEESVILKDDELPAIESKDISVLKKYGILLTPTGILNQNDIETFKKYKIKLPQGEKSSLKQIQEAYKLSIALKKFPGDVANKDRIVFQKFGLELEKKRFYQNQKVVYVAVPVILFFMIYIGSLAGRYYKSIKIHEKQTQLCNDGITTLDTYISNLKKQSNKMYMAITTLKNKYPSKHGYPDPHPKIFNQLKSLTTYIGKLENTLQNGKEEFEVENMEEALKIIGIEAVKKKYEKDFNKQSKILEKIDKRLNGTLKMAQFMYQARSRQMKIRKASRILREHIVGYYQKMKTLEENWRNLRENYPPEKEFPPPPVGGEKLLKKTKDHVDGLRNSLKQIELAIINDKSKKAVELCTPFLKTKMDVSSLVEMNDSVLEVLSVCERMAQERKLKKEGLQLLLSLGKRMESLQQEYDSINSHIEKLDSFPISLGIPRPDQKAKGFLDSNKRELLKLKGAIQKARTLLYQKEFKTSVAMLKKLEEKISPINELKRINTNIKDALFIARSMKKRSDMGNEVAFLLQNTKEKLYKLETATELLETQISKLKTDFTVSKGYPKAKVSYKSKLRKARSLRRSLRAIVRKVGTYFEEKSLNKALRILKKYSSRADRVDLIEPSLKLTSGVLKKHLERCEELSKERKLLRKVNSRRRKVANYLRELDDQLLPLSKNLKSMETKFAGPSYPKVSKDVYPILNLGKLLSGKIHKLLKDSKYLEKQKEFTKLLDFLNIHKLKKLMNRDMIAKLSKYRYKVDDMVFESLAIQKQKLKVAKVKEFLNELKTRYKNLKIVITAFKKAVKDSKEKYKVNKGYLPINPNSETALTEGKLEINELKNVINIAEDKLYAGQYDKAINIIKPYSNKINPGISKLNFIKSIYRLVKQVTDKNKRIASDANYRKAIQKKIEQDKEKAKLRKKWEHSPGKWFDEVVVYTKEIVKLKDDISLKLKDRGARYLFPRALGAAKSINRIPKEVGELEEMIYNIGKYKVNFLKILSKKEREAMIPKQKRQIIALRTFYKKRKIKIDTSRRMKLLKDSMAKLKAIIKGTAKEKSISKDLVKDIYKALKPIEDKFQEAYVPISSELINVDAGIKAGRFK